MIFFTAYGYGGVVTNSKEYLSPQITEAFNQAFTGWCEDNHVVTEFIERNSLYKFQD